MAKKITVAAIAEQKFKNWLTARNAYARQGIANGIALNTIDEAGGRKEYENLTRALLVLGNATHPEHNARMAELRNRFEGASVDHVVTMADDLRGKMNAIAQNAMAAGQSPEVAQATALNSYFGNPGYDQFANLQLMSDQLYEQLTFMQSFIEEGDGVQLAPDVAASAKAISRFRLPRIQSSGSPKTRQGDLNGYTADRLYSNNLAQISLLSEFKDATTEDQGFVIDTEQQQALMGYARSIAPGLAGFILQNQLMATVEQQIMQRAEVAFVDGFGTSPAYTDGEGGNYGLLTQAIMLALASAGAASPALATGADWAANPNTLIQQITNFNYKPADRTLPLSAVTAAEAAQIYADVVRLLNLIALTNVATSGRVVLYMPTSIYAALVQYLGTGTFNRQLGEAIRMAIGGTIKNIEIKTSGLLNARTNSLNAQQYNHVVAVVHGAPTNKKAIVSPLATATPRFSTGLVSEQRSTFAASLTFGGPFVLQRGQVFDLVFSVNA